MGTGVLSPGVKLQGRETDLKCRHKLNSSTRYVLQVFETDVSLRLAAHGEGTGFLPG
jgi:hypothetical protein